MKKMVLVLVLLLSVGVSAQDFLEDKSDYRAQMRRILGVSQGSDYLTDANANAFIEQAVASILPLTVGKKKLTSFVTTFRDYDYPLDTTMVGIISVWWSKGDTVKPLIPRPISEWRGSEVHTTTYEQEDAYMKRPSYYDFSDDSIFVFPVPAIATGDTIKVLGYSEETSPVADSVFTGIEQRYRTAILNYAVWLAASARQDQRTNMFFEVMMWHLQMVEPSIAGRKSAPNAGN